MVLRRMRAPTSWLWLHAILAEDEPANGHGHAAASQRRGLLRHQSRTEGLRYQSRAALHRCLRVASVLAHGLALGLRHRMQQQRGLWLPIGYPGPLTSAARPSPTCGPPKRRALKCSTIRCASLGWPGADGTPPEASAWAVALCCTDERLACFFRVILVCSWLLKANDASWIGSASKALVMTVVL